MRIARKRCTLFKNEKHALLHWRWSAASSHASSIGSGFALSKLRLRLCTRQTRTIRPLSIRQSHAFDHFSIRRSLLERKRNVELASERFDELRSFFGHRVNSRSEI